MRNTGHRRRINRLAVATVAVLTLTAGCTGRGSPNPATGDGTDPGQTTAAQDATPISIGGSFPQSGPLAAAGASAIGAKAYFDMVNEDGGVNGHLIEFTALDDAYDPARLAANNRKLVEQEKATILLNFGGIAVSNRPYVSSQGVAQIVEAANSPLSDVEEFPFTRGFWPDISWEGQLQAAWIQENMPDAVVGLVGFNNDLTDSQLEGLQAGGVDPVEVIRVPPGTGDLSSQANQLRSADIDVVLLSVGAPSAGAIIRYMKQTGYEPQLILSSTMTEMATVIAPAGPENVSGAIAFRWFDDPADPSAKERPELEEYATALESAGSADVADQGFTLHGYGMAAAVVSALEAAEDPTTSEGFLEGWDSLTGVTNPLLLEGTQLEAGAAGRLVHQYRLMEFDGTTWVSKADIVDTKAEGIAE